MAVITLIGILGLITVPIINNTIKNSRKKAFKETLNAIVDAAKIYNADTDYLVITEENGLNVLNKNLKYENKSEILAGRIYYEDGEFRFDYVVSKYYCAFGYTEEIEVYDINDEKCDLNK